jgi:Ca2+-binding RTX toxin-like protein
MPTFNLTNGNDIFPGGQPGWINTGEDIVNGFDGDDDIDGGLLNDSLSGMNGNDEMLGGSGDDVINGGAHDDILSGGTENDTIQGEGGVDVIHGDDGNDTLKGGEGNDTIFGDGGNDTFDVSGDVVGANDIDVLSGGEGDDKILTTLIVGTNASVSFDGGNGTDTVGAFGSLIGYTFTNVETLDNLYLIRATTQQLNQFSLFTDHYAFSDYTDIFVESAGTVDFRGKLGTGVIDLHVESMGFANTIYGDGGNDRLWVAGTGTAAVNFFGGGGNDDLRGGFGDDVLDGGSGNDLFYGGSGIDIVTYADATGSITLNLQIFGFQNTTSAGMDDVSDSSNEIIQGSAFDDTFIGNNFNQIFKGGAGNDTLEGANGDDTLEGQAGNDTLNGGSGSDFADYSSSTASVSVNLNTLVAQNTGTATGLDTLIDIENIRGGALVDTLIGNAQGNVLDGGGGADSMTGGLGNDTYVLDQQTDVTVEAANGGTDTAVVFFTHALRANFENLVLAGTDNINGTGNAMDNDLTGNSGNNVLNGLAGIDDMAGLGGNDTYWIDNALDTASETFNQGIDIVQAYVSFALGNDIEKLYLRPGAVNATGNAISNYIYGNSTANLIDGQGGADRLYGYDGNDTYVVDSSGDLIFEVSAAGGTDTIQSSVNHTLATNVENLTLTGAATINGTGNTLANVIVGNTGVNFLDGKLGGDTLTGGLGNDQFLFTTTLGASNVDTITDFSVPNDTIRLDDAIFAGLTTLAYLSASQFTIGAAATTAAHRIVYNSATGTLLFDADGNGAGAAKQFATLSTGLALTATDFFVF